MKTIPGYGPVAFRDTTTGDVMIIPSAVQTKDTIVLDGRTLPLCDLDVSSQSHPAYTKTGVRRPKSDQIEKFRRRYKL